MDGTDSGNNANIVTDAAQSSAPGVAASAAQQQIKSTEDSAGTTSATQGQGAELPASGADDPQDGAVIPASGSFVVRIAKVVPGAASLPREITITLLGPASEEALALYTGVSTTIATLRSLFLTVPQESDGELKAGPDEEAVTKYNAYIYRLYLIAKDGLEAPGLPKDGQTLLTAFQNEILARESAWVKNDYMRRLGYWALVFAAAAAAVLLVVAIAGALLPKDLLHEGNALDALLVLWMGAMGGCWLSFGLRNPNLTMTSIAQPDADLFVPNLRLLFTGGLALVLGLVFLSGAVQVNIGGLDTTKIFAADSAESLAAVLLIGLFCGISEQALSTTIGQRAEQFVGGIKP